MTTHIGKEGSVTAGGTSVGEVTSFQFTERTATIPDPALGDDWETHKPGMKSWDGTMTCMIDPSDTAQEAMTNGASVALVLYVEGTGGGAKTFSGTVTIEEIGVNVAGNDALTERSFSFKGNGALTPGTV